MAATPSPPQPYRLVQSPPPPYEQEEKMNDIVMDTLVALAEHVREVTHRLTEVERVLNIV